MSVRIFGHQNIAASLHILVIPGCPKFKAYRAVYRSVLGMMIRSSTMTMPHLWVKFFGYGFEVVWDLVAVVFFEAAVYFYQFWVGGRFFNQCFQIQHGIQFGCSYVVLLLLVSGSFLFYYPVYLNIVDSYVFDGAVKVFLNGYCGKAPGSCIVTASSVLDDVVDSLLLFSCSVFSDLGGI